MGVASKQLSAHLEDKVQEEDRADGHLCIEAWCQRFQGCLECAAISGVVLVFAVISVDTGGSNMFADRTIVSVVGDYARTDPITRLPFQGLELHDLFGGWLAHIGVGPMLNNGQPFVPSVPNVLLWWFAVAITRALVIAKTYCGDWIPGVGGNARSERQMRVTTFCRRPNRPSTSALSRCARSPDVLSTCFG
ncbi:hypothetical protein [Paraburkholderia lacunae]|uniref:hypothetical protein n=1 Tax=Paraburkholderia lacunae TaxID=2211104 RepID=UPI001058A6DC|nr:hypothetical protein [Paraburkholderia lacunae]